MNDPVTAEERERLAEEINAAILRTIDRAGFRNGKACEASYSAAKMVVNRVTERKKVGA